MRHQRTIMVAGNWKMNLKVGEASRFMHRLEEKIAIRQNVECVLAPNYLALQPLSVYLDRRKFRLASQDGHYADFGAFTGEVSMAMLHDIVHYSIIGHSDRRHKFNETDDVIGKKVQSAIRNDIIPILCVGETLQERLAGETKHTIHRQLTSGLINITAREASIIVVAYEPVWAISTAENHKDETPEDAQKTMAYIRSQLRDLHGERAAKYARILFGGSVNQHNARAFLELKDCDGVLVGGASLDADQFASIHNTAYKVAQMRDE